MAKGFKTGGRQKGTPNKITHDLKEMVVKALHKAGGVAYLARQAEANPSAFLALVGRVLPLQVGDVGDGPILIVTGIERPQIAQHNDAKVDGGTRVIEHDSTELLPSKRTRPESDLSSARGGID